MIKLFFIVYFLVFFSLPSGAEEKFDNAAAENVVKTVSGLKFSVPADRPIKEKDGIVAPMAIDEYVALKFSRLEARLQEIENSLNDITQRIQLLTKEMETLKQKLASP